MAIASSSEQVSRLEIPENDSAIANSATVLCELAQDEEVAKPIVKTSGPQSSQKRSKSFTERLANGLKAIVKRIVHLFKRTSWP